MATRTEPYQFPPLEEATVEGLLAIGGDLSSERLLAAYRKGIFPWYNPGQPILWWSPDPRTVLYPNRLRISRSLRKTLRHRHFHITTDKAFDRVIVECAESKRDGTVTGTWITANMRSAYLNLYQLGYAHSVETWQHNRLVGGLYGVAIGGIFFGESMFSVNRDASKVALAGLVSQLLQLEFRLIDCQLPSTHLFSLGAQSIPRLEFVEELQLGINTKQMSIPWELAIDAGDLA
ncbi:MAG TPA: leucyl/phenylalanyl-tRNA--protein transferase [Gammaproteobacteria bacterium]|jgi:leucyl/phenylalanyl-tRNA--protein transferase|nr:leucyl/phenylalanyl-tRNA--protein transferase [Arenicellales bacterium]HIG12946.1 leucyl/phenylalanyl-tRNA--protein transferase [Gammaproteobacteria bacterium]|tara:strand:- start:22 stop:723 length:702 start_codon:yes stop_codon:yes gene_type:complete